MLTCAAAYCAADSRDLDKVDNTDERGGVQCHQVLERGSGDKADSSHPPRLNDVFIDVWINTSITKKHSIVLCYGGCSYCR